MKKRCILPNDYKTDCHTSWFQVSRCYCTANNKTKTKSIWADEIQSHIVLPLKEKNQPLTNLKFSK